MQDHGSYSAEDVVVFFEPIDYLSRVGPAEVFEIFENVCRF
jgi:hypothetical protein